MNKVTKDNVKIIILLIVVFIILYFLHITIGDNFVDQYGGPSHEDEINIFFRTDKISKTLTVEEIFSQGRTLYWPEVIVTEGSATLPFGTIDIGDKITDCEGHLVLKWKDTDNLIFSNDFD